MNRFILRWMINAVALYVAVLIVPGLRLESNWLSVVWLALIFGFVNALLRPVLKFLTCPLIVLTLGLFSLLINAFLFWLTAQVGQFFGIYLTVEGFWPALFGAVIVSLVSVVLSLVFKDELKGRG
jgi:putative membrane protein